MKSRAPLTTAEKRKVASYLTLSFLLLCLCVWLYVEIGRMKGEIQALKEYDHALNQATRHCIASQVSVDRSPACDEFERLARRLPVEYN